MTSLAGQLAIKYAEDPESIHTMIDTLFSNDVLTHDDFIRLGKAFDTLYGIKLETGVAFWDNQNTGSRPQDKILLKKAIQICLAEIERYPETQPTAFFKNNPFTPLRRIRFVHELKKGNSPTERRRIGGTVSASSDEIIIDLPASLSLDRNVDEFRETVHHEIQHNVVERIPNGAAYKARWDDIVKETKFMYIGYDQNVLEPNPAPLHMVSSYAARARNEDMAEFAAHMMSPKLHTELLKKVRRAEQFIAKPKSISPAQRANLVALVQKYALMKTIYLEASRGMMDEKFWVKLRATKTA